MGNINIDIDDDIEKEFREAIGRRYGVQKGNLKRAFSEAIRLWLTDDGGKKQQ